MGNGSSKCPPSPVGSAPHMKLLAWNLNHRAARRRLPPWIAESITARAPDVAVLTEYVQGVDHAAFCRDLAAAGLAHVSTSARVDASNQVLIASRQPHCQRPLPPTDIHPCVIPNALSVSLEHAGLEVLGFRMPAYETQTARLKRQTWEWLLAALEPMRHGPAVVAGDFNTAFGDRRSGCGDCLALLVEQGWRHASPEPGAVSYRTKSGPGRLIDHAFVSPAIPGARAEYWWGFPQAAWGTPGRPDHAMLVVEID